MITKFRLFPDSASTVSGEVNGFFIAMLVLCSLVAIAVAGTDHLFRAALPPQARTSAGRPAAV